MNKLVIAFAVLTVLAVGYVSANQTDCQRRAARERLVTSLPGHVVPECDEHGDYKAMQCFGQPVGGGRPFCACYSRDYQQIKGPSRRIVSCDCIRERYEAGIQRPRNSTIRIPTCNDTTGEYTTA